MGKKVAAGVDVALTHGPESVKPQVKQINATGKFCFEVPPSEYRVSAFAPRPESDPELLLLPQHLDFAVNNPVLNVEFYQTQVNVLGVVACKKKCGSSISVTLSKLGGKSKEEKNTVYLTDKSSEFSFPNVFPGKYRLEVKHSSGENQWWCREQNSIDMDVATVDVKDIAFVQKGYWVNVISTHDVDANVIHPDGSLMTLNIKKGSQNICLESPGEHELRFAESCISFGTSTIKFDTSKSEPIKLKGEKYLLGGEIHVDSSLLNGEEELPHDISIDILNYEGALLDSTAAKLVASRDNQPRVAVYSYTVWVNTGEKLALTPKDLRNKSERKILFYPRQHIVLVAHDNCEASVPPFSGRPGLYIQGSVFPSLPDVCIKITAAADSCSTALRKGELALETKTGLDGIFIGGPLYDDISYSVEASKPGYHVKLVGPYSFSCQKLGQISVRLYSTEDTTELFPSVLLSLSGENGYRNNSITGVGGIFIFVNLFPGSFYIRPLLKEYAFSPPAQAFDLGSGEAKEISFQATHVAYSAMGMITLLSGQPVEGVSLEARSESEGHYEETVADFSGNYRLRGLLPDTTYVVKVVDKGGSKGSRIERASPKSVAINVGTKDIKDLDFMVFEQPEMTILSGHVEGKRLDELNSHLQIEIMSATDPSKIGSIFHLPLTNYFQIRTCQRVDLGRHPQIHIGPIRYKLEEYFQQESTPIPVYSLIVVISVFALLTMPRLKDLSQAWDDVNQALEDLYQTMTRAYMSSLNANRKKQVRKKVTKKAY